MRFFILVLAVFLGAAGSARASAVDDLQAGGNLYFTAASARFDGDNFHTGAWDIPKAAGSLDIVLPLSTFGYSHPGSITLSGSRRGSEIVWTFDERLTPEIRDGDIRVQRVNGSIVGRVRYLPGALSPTCSGAACNRSVSLRESAGSTIRVRGCKEILFACIGFDERISVRHFHAHGGLPRPTLDRVSIPDGSARCSTSTPTRLSGLVTLRSPAPSRGATVELLSTQRSRVRVYSARVPPGRRSARFSVYLDGGWIGSAQIVAAAGGATDLALIRRDPCPFVLDLEHLLELPLYGDYYGVLTNRRVLLRSKEGNFVFDTGSGEAKALTPPAELDGFWIVAHSGNGEVLGDAIMDGQPVTVRWNVGQDVESPLLLEGVVPVSINPHGVALAREDETGSWMVIDDFGPREFPLLDEVPVANTVQGRSGIVVANLDVGGGSTVAWVDQEPVVEDALAVALNASDTLIGHSKEGQPFRWNPDAGLEWLPVPDGCDSAEAVGIDDSGTALVNVRCGQWTRPYMVDPDGAPHSLVALEQFPDLEWTAVAMSDDHAVLLRATEPGAETRYFLLQAEDNQ